MVCQAIVLGYIAHHAHVQVVCVIRRRSQVLIVIHRAGLVRQRECTYRATAARSGSAGSAGIVLFGIGEVPSPDRKAAPARKTAAPAKSLPVRSERGRHRSLPPNTTAASAFRYSSGRRKWSVFNNLWDHQRSADQKSEAAAGVSGLRHFFPSDRKWPGVHRRVGQRHKRHAMDLAGSPPIAELRAGPALALALPAIATRPPAPPNPPPPRPPKPRRRARRTRPPPGPPPPGPPPGPPCPSNCPPSGPPGMPIPPIIMPKSGCAFCARPWLRLPETWKVSLLFWPSAGAAVAALPARRSRSATAFQADFRRSARGPCAPCAATAGDSCNCSAKSIFAASPQVAFLVAGSKPNMRTSMRAVARRRRGEGVVAMSDP